MRAAWTVLTALALSAACGPSAEPGGKGSPGPSPSPSSSPTPTPVTSTLAVSNSTAVIYFHDAANFAQIDGMTWDGLVGTATALPDYHAANPSGTLFGSATELRNREGVVVNRGSYGLKYFSATWADDDVHFCFMEPFDFLGANGVPATLKVGSAEGGISSVAQVGKIYEQVSTYVASCSIAADRAVVVQSGGQGVGVAQYWVVQISSGKTLWTHDFMSGAAPLQLVSSRDGRYIAEDFDSASGSQTSTIYDPNGSRVTQFNAAVAAFSWDDALVALSTRQGPQPALIVKLDGESQVWAAPVSSGRQVWRVMAEPNGTRLAVGITNPAYQPAGPQTTGYAPLDLYLVDATGQVVKVARAVYW